MKRTFKENWILFWTMFKIGAFTFGAAFAMIPLMSEQLVNKRGYFTDEEMSDALAVAQALPGVITVNTSVLCGYKINGYLGALFAVIGLALPSMITLTAITYLYESFVSNLYVAAALKGVRACVIALLVSAFLKLSKHFKNDKLCIAIFLAAFIAAIFKVNNIYIIIAGAMIGILAEVVKKHEQHS